MFVYLSLHAPPPGGKIFLKIVFLPFTLLEAKRLMQTGWIMAKRGKEIGDERSELRRGSAGAFNALVPAIDNLVGNLGDMLLQNQAKVAPGAVIGGSHKMNPVGMIGQLVTFFKR